LCDIDKDGKLDVDEFILGMHLIEESKYGKPLPTYIPIEMVPPNKRPS